MGRSGRDPGRPETTGTPLSREDPSPMLSIVRQTTRRQLFAAPLGILGAGRARRCPAVRSAILALEAARSARDPEAATRAENDLTTALAALEPDSGVRYRAVTLAGRVYFDREL